MSNRPIQYNVPKDNLYYLYRFIVLPWEVEWKNLKFSTNEGDLKAYEKDNNILLKCFENINALEVESNKCTNEYKKYAGVMLFNRTDNKPKAVLRHLRNLSAHGNFRFRMVNKRPCLGFEHYGDDKRLRVIGYIPFDEFNPMIKAIMTTKMD